ncbi:MAG: glycosyltransferase family 4 protein [Clostridia bacterium]|nr:glycosyltransferase family 4 protein [Clostridia bacterium]
MMKKVAFVRGTGIYNDSRSTKEILALVEAGYLVEVLCWDRDGNASTKCKETFVDVLDKVNFSFYSVPAENGIGLKNINKLIGWFRWVVKTLKNSGELKAVHACDLDSGIPARKYCKRRKVKLVYDIFDYYVDSHHIPSIMSKMVENMEIKVINFASVTIICTEERVEQIAKAKPQKVIVIHNSPEMDTLSESEIDTDYFYCGAMAGKRLIVEILGEYKENSDLKVTFAGYGPYSLKAEEISKQYENFSFLGALSYSQVLSLEARSRVLAAIYEPTVRNHRLCAPNKFYEALALGKPVIVCKGTGIDKIVEENDIGCVINYDAGEFYFAVRKLCNSENYQQMGVRARKLYVEKYDWKIMKGILVSAYGEL